MAEDRDTAVEILQPRVGCTDGNASFHAHLFRLFVLARLAALSLSLHGCSGPLSTLDPAGPVADSIATLWWVMLVGACIILVGVCLLALLPFLGSGQKLPQSSHVYLWGGAIVFTLGTLTALLVYAFTVQSRHNALRADVQPVRIHAIARQWSWQFVYPDAPGGPRTSNRLYLPAETSVSISLTSQDVIHSFWVPRLAGKRDAIPGHVNEIVLVARDPGVYGAVCAEFCGLGHATMTFVVEVLAPADFAAMMSAESRGSMHRVQP